MPNDFILNTLRGGLNLFDPPTALDQDQCTVAENVEFWLSTCGEKRRGTTTIPYGGAGYTSIGVGSSVVTFLFRHLPTGDETQAELWSLWLNSPNTYLERMTTSGVGVNTWHDIGLNLFSSTGSNPYRMNACSLHGKLYFAGVNFLPTETGVLSRMAVWDGAQFRAVGQMNPTVSPTVSNSGSGTFSGVRYYRTRYVYNPGVADLLISEPSPVATFTPSGSGSGATIASPPPGVDVANFYVVEASIDNVNFYEISGDITLGSPFTDTIAAYTTGYGPFGTLSNEIGDYRVPWSARFVINDEDRLVFAGSFQSTTDGLGSTVGWTAVAADPTGVGNDERVPVATQNTLALDTLDGGDFTGMSKPTNGYIYVFKQSRIYQLARTDNVDAAYSSLLLTTARGAIVGSIVEGIDENGNPCVYFLDPRVGPCRIGLQGLQMCGFDITPIWSTFNIDALVNQLPVVSYFYPDKWQVHFLIATNGFGSPNKKIVVQINNMETITAAGINTPASYGGMTRRGWSTASSGASVFAFSACMFSNNLGTTNPLSYKLVPFIGLYNVLTGNNNLIQQTDIGSLDNGANYSAQVVSRPQILNNLLQKGGTRASALLAAPSTGTSISVAVIGDFGVPEKTNQIDGISLTPQSTETQLIIPLDNIFETDSYVVQISFGDLSTNTSGLWQVNGISSKAVEGESV